MHSYRMDNRTKEQFAHDIQIGTSIEKDIIERYASFAKSKYGIELEIEDNGCDNSGQFLADSQVSTKADFKINGKPVEVKFNNQKLQLFRLKASQLKSYLHQGATLLWVNGYETNTPMATFLTTKHLEKIRDTKTPVLFDGWGGKLCYEMQTVEFKWFKLDYEEEAA